MSAPIKLQVEDRFGVECEWCGWPLEQGEWGVWDEDNAVYTCSRTCAARVRVRIMERERGASQGRGQARGLPLFGDAWMYDGDRHGGPTFDGRPGS